MSTFAALSDLPDVDQMRGGDPALLKDEILWQITETARTAPRSLQTKVGPSELGTPCGRRLAYKMAGVEPVNDRGAAWKPVVGTAVHAWLADAFTEANRNSVLRWLVEMRVDVGEILGVPVTGSCDLFDRMTATAIDFKIAGVASLRAKKANGPGDQYRAQLHLYGRGMTRRGLSVDRVGLLALPQNGELSEAWWWTEPYDEQIAVDALSRAEVIASLVAAGGSGAAPLIPTAEAFCTYCPHFLPSSTELEEACPGHKDQG